MSAARTLTSGSMFSGIGGIDLGFHRAGIETKWFCECDRYACDVLRKHWPGVPIYPDVTKLRGCDVEYVDIIHGGFPCQDISPAGKRKGLEGSRSSLYRELWRVVCEVGPDYVVMENSPGLLDLGADHVLAQMADGGYDAEWQVLSAASVGSCQRRDRLFIVGIRRGGGDSHVPDPRLCGLQMRQEGERELETARKEREALGSDPRAVPHADRACGSRETFAKGNNSLWGGAH